jgi:DUF4097 and DUF4098 domain-containing protein YvlB
MQLQLFRRGLRRGQQGGFNVKTCLSVALVSLALAGPSRAEVLRESSSQVAGAAGVRAVTVDNARGAIQVTASPDGEIHLTALKEVRASSSSQRRHLADEITVSAGNEGGTYAVRVDYGSSGSFHLGFWDLVNGVDLPRSDLKLTLAIPSGLPLTLHSASGDLSTSGISGAQWLESASGDMDIRDAGGEVQANTMSGDVQASGLQRARVRTSSGDCEIKDVSGPISVRTGSGDITVRGARDSLDLSSGSGDLDIERAPRGVRARTASGRIGVNQATGAIELDSASGDVEIGLHDPLARADIGTESGDVQVTLDELSGASIRLETSSGSIDATATMRVKSADRHSLVASVGTGRAPVSVRTSSGDIHVTSGGR